MGYERIVIKNTKSVLRNSKEKFQAIMEKCQLGGWVGREDYAAREQ